MHFAWLLLCKLFRPFVSINAFELIRILKNTKYVCDLIGVISFSITFLSRNVGEIQHVWRTSTYLLKARSMIIKCVHPLNWRVGRTLEVEKLIEKVGNSNTFNSYFNSFPLQKIRELELHYENLRSRFARPPPQ